MPRCSVSVHCRHFLLHLCVLHALLLLTLWSTRPLSTLRCLYSLVCLIYWPVEKLVDALISSQTPTPSLRLYFLHLDFRVIYCSSDNILFFFASFELKICSLCGCRMQAMMVCCNAKCSVQVAQKAETWASCFTSTTVKIRHNKHGCNELWGCPSLISVCREYYLLITSIAYNEGITMVNVNLLWRSLTVLSSVLVHCAVSEWTAPVADGCSHVGAHCHCANCIFLILICQREQCAMQFFFFFSKPTAC